MIHKNFTIDDFDRINDSRILKWKDYWGITEFYMCQHLDLFANIIGGVYDDNDGNLNIAQIQNHKYSWGLHIPTCIKFRDLKKRGIF